MSAVPVVPFPFLLQPQEIELAIWVTSFSSLHIGMSAVRESLISICGNAAQDANLVNRNIISLPSWWPGDDVGGSDVFPDQETAGRQIYRMIYTIVSFVTLGGALMSYLSFLHVQQVQGMDMGSSGVGVGVGITNAIPFHEVVPLTETEYGTYFTVATLSFAASIASLFNASPLSLMPGFQTASSEQQQHAQKVQVQDSTPIAGLTRNDSLKLQPKGLTRITRHPLILPVVPWGIATSHLAGGRVMDWILFGGLALYAVAGCACQDLRIMNQEGSVGTVFQPSYLSSSSSSSSNVDDNDKSLEGFFANTSFVPFAAVLDGRQSMNDIGREFPFLPFILLGIPVGTSIENALLQWLDHYI